MFSGLDTPAAKIVIAFHHALNTGDKITAKSLLADDVTIYEGGGVERSADEYAQHHMNSDMEYLSSVTNKALNIKSKFWATQQSPHRVSSMGCLREERLPKYGNNCLNQHRRRVENQTYSLVKLIRLTTRESSYEKIFNHNHFVFVIFFHFRS